MLRKTTSMVLFLSGVFVLLTSIILYIEPHGRVAYWADWRFWGLSKGSWDALHITTGFLFLVAGLLHMYYNWKAIMAYMKNKARDLVVLTVPTTAALVLTLYFAVGTFFGLPPMQQILDFSEHIKEGHIQTLGAPPYGHAELSKLKKFAGYMGVSEQEAVTLLWEAGITATGEETLADIAARNDASPQQIFEIIKKGTGGKVAMPAMPPEGMGKLSFSSLCSQYGLDEQAAVHYLAAQDVTATGDMTIKQIAAKAGRQPMDIYQLLKAFAEKN
ncbi:MAG: DUF4405 domain-containing protein [Desulfovibrio sp.]|uniref:DUF4405 domain-containing protein n=1 Tax=Desulfovibrio sp. 7SRBS1 TaxID=3378064 RepID=UPI003B42431C